MRETDTISSWIAPNSNVLDLGCGNGELLSHLAATKNTKGYGLEIDAACIEKCIQYGVSVLEQNFDEGLANFPDGSFDVVLLASTLQAAKRPDVLVREMLRIGKRAVVTFPNFSHWYHRWHLFAYGKMPVSKHLPYSWYDTPNIHHCTISDFNKLCRDNKIRILERRVEGPKMLTQLVPNLFASQAMYLLCR